MAYFLADYVFAAKYPFSSKAKEIMRERSVEPNEFMAEKGFNRVSAALNGELRRKLFLHEEDAIEEMIEYAAARMMLSYMRNRFLTNKYAISESKKAFAYLGDESEENVSALAKDIGISSFKEDAGRLTIDVADFLLYAPKDVHYKLISRELNRGRVSINRHERIRIISEAVKKYMERMPPAQSIPPAIKKAAERLHELLPKIEPQKISFKEGENPPCIEAMLDTLKKHENLGHTGRWLLVVYMINRGVGNADLVKVFSNAPDFNEKTTVYQVEHARKRAYKMPTCSSVVGYGYCVADCGIRNPMSWRSGMKVRLRAGAEKSEGKEEKEVKSET